MKKRGFTLVEIMIVLAIIGLIVSIAVPAFLKNRRDAQGSACNGQLDSIFGALEQIAFKLNVKPSEGAQPAVGPEEINSYLRGTDVGEPCPMGGTYNVPTAAGDADGQVIVPTCSVELLDDGTSGKTWGEQGLHIHRRSYIQDAATGLYSQNPDYSFAGGA